MTNQFLKKKKGLEVKQKLEALSVGEELSTQEVSKIRSLLWTVDSVYVVHKLTRESRIIHYSFILISAFFGCMIFFACLTD